MRSFSIAGLTFLLACVGCGGDDSSSGSGGATSTGGTTSTGGQAGGGTGGQAGSATGGQGGTGGATDGGLSSFTSQGTSSFETQTSLAADAKGGILVVWNSLFADNTSSIGYAVSRDGGDTFTPPAYVASPGGRLASNPVVAVDGQGVFTLAWLGFRADSTNPDEHVYVARLDGASETFGAPVVASDDGTSTTRDFDKPGIAVDANDNLLLTWADFTGVSGGGSPSLTFARSVDGTTFTKSTVAADSTFGNLAYICLDRSLGPTAPLYMVHLAEGATVTVRKSVDQGATWPMLPAPPATSVVFQDPTCVVQGTKVVVAYGTGTAVFDPNKDAPADAIEVMTSTDGTNFGTPTVATDGSSKQYLFPKLARSAAGKLELVYYEGVVDAAASFMHATSSDGATWTRTEIASAGKLTIDRTLASWLGGYVGFATGATTGWASYTENSANKTHIAFTKVPAP
jgi:hypothetical protein